MTLAWTTNTTADACWPSSLPPRYQVADSAWCLEKEPSDCSHDHTWIEIEHQFFSKDPDKIYHICRLTVIVPSSDTHAANRDTHTTSRYDANLSSWHIYIIKCIHHTYIQSDTRMEHLVRCAKDLIVWFDVLLLVLSPLEQWGGGGGGWFLQSTASGHQTSQYTW